MLCSHSHLTAKKHCGIATVGSYCSQTVYDPIICVYRSDKIIDVRLVLGSNKTVAILSNTVVQKSVRMTISSI